MRTTRLIMLALLLTCVLGVQGAWAETKGYIDIRTNPTTGWGVLGARYEGISGSAIDGWASATSGTTYGGEFSSSSSSGMGVKGRATATSGRTYGGFFQNESTSGTGVYGVANASSGSTYGGSFKSQSTSGIGVYGYASATTGYTCGGSFRTNSSSGRGVSGVASAAYGSTTGGSFESHSTNGTGAKGVATTATGVNYGLYGQTSSPSGYGVYSKGNMKVEGKLVATGGGWFQSASTGVLGVATTATGVNYGVYGQTNNPSGYGVYSKGNMKVEGKFTVTGTKSAVVKTKNGKGVTLYAVEASENWFEDFGASKLKEGKAVVQIDPTFAETVNTDMDYHVFLTPNGDCKGLFVTDKKGTSFEVRELTAGKSDISFSYRIVAKRKGYEDQRLVQVNEDQTSTMATSELDNPQEQKVLEMAAQVK